MFRNAGPISSWVLNADDPEVGGARRAPGGLHGCSRSSPARTARRPSTADGSSSGAAAHRGGSSPPGRSQRGERAGRVARGDGRGASAPHGGGAGAGGRAGSQLPRARASAREGGGTGGVLWINDSKSTNVSSTLVAIRGMTRPVVAPARRPPQGRALHRAGPWLRRIGRAVIAYGEAAPLIEADLEAWCRRQNGIDFDAVLARRASSRSPATPSCSLRPVRATTCSRTTSSAARNSGGSPRRARDGTARRSRCASAGAWASRRGRS